MLYASKSDDHALEVDAAIHALTGDGRLSLALNILPSEFEHQPGANKYCIIRWDGKAYRTVFSVDQVEG